MSPIRNTELVVIIFDVKPEQEQEHKKKRKLSRINLLLRLKSSNKQDPSENGRKKNSSRFKKKDSVQASTSDNPTGRKLSVLSQFCSKKTTSKLL